MKRSLPTMNTAGRRRSCTLITIITLHSGLRSLGCLTLRACLLSTRRTFSSGCITRTVVRRRRVGQISQKGKAAVADIENRRGGEHLTCAPWPCLYSPFPRCPLLPAQPTDVPSSHPSSRASPPVRRIDSALLPETVVPPLGPSVQRFCRPQASRAENGAGTHSAVSATHA